MRVLVACEFSGVVRDAFRARGHDAVSCDLLPTEVEGPHYCGDVRDILHDGWDLMIAHPDCTYLCSSGLHWNKRVEGREQKTEEALEFVKELMDAPIPRIAIENPVGRIGTAIRKADQYIQPWMFGHDIAKKTGLWLKNLPILWATDVILPSREYEGKPRWSNQCLKGGQDATPPSKDRWKTRAKTHTGIAEAMAEQWGSLDETTD